MMCQMMGGGLVEGGVCDDKMEEKADGENQTDEDEEDCGRRAD